MCMQKLKIITFPMQHVAILVFVTAVVTSKSISTLITNNNDWFTMMPYIRTMQLTGWYADPHYDLTNWSSRSFKANK